ENLSLKLVKISFSTKSESIHITKLILGENCGGDSRCVYGGFEFIRNISYYIIRYYSTTFLCICISCLSPWITILAYPGRTILCATVLLAVIRISSIGFEEVTSGSIVALYWWLWMAQLFIFFTLVEYALAISWYQFVREKRLALETRSISPDGYYFGKNGLYKKCGEFVEKILHLVFGPIDFAANPLHRNKVDYFARLLMPFALMIFVVAYLIFSLSLSPFSLFD
ncbi:hypothetical protein QR98_0101250, partial [Sarcoptes scabiei]